MANSMIRFEKILDTLPQTLTPNTTYFLKNSTNGRLTQYLSDSLGAALIQVSGKTPSLVDLGLDNVNNTSDADKSVSIATQSALDLKIDTSKIGAASGVAGLDANKKVLLTNLPDSILGGLSYQGIWDTSTALPTASTSNKGWYYIASNAATDGSYLKGDWAVSNGVTWDKIDNTGAVQSVAGRTGVVVLTSTDVGLENVDNTSDILKPISTATQTALDAKVDKTTYTTDLALKADKTDVTAELALKADKVDISNSLALKADKTDVTTELALKADATALTSGLALKADKTDITASLALKIDTSKIGVASGVAELDANQKIPTSRLPDSILGSLNYQGAQDMGTALPAASSANKGWYYIASNASPVNGYTKGDWAVSNGTSWDRIDNTSAVQSVAGRTGVVTLTTADLTDFATAVTTPLGLKAPLASPTFTGTVTVPTPTTGDNSTAAASTAFVTAAIGAKAPLASPTFTGTVTVPTMTAGDNTTAAASTEFVTNALSVKAPLASPTFTGTVTVPTATAGDSSTAAASTAFVATSFAPLSNAALITPTITGLKEVRVNMAANEIDLALGGCFIKTISALTTFTLKNVPVSGVFGSFILDLTNGGAFTITWWTGLKWTTGTAPTLTATGRDVLGFFTHDGGTTWNGLVLSKNMK